MAKANRRDLSGVGGAAQEDLIATATMAERIGVSPYTLREALGSIAKRVAVVFKRRDQVGGFISIYKVSQGETLPNRPRVLEPGLWMTHSAVGGEQPCPYTLAELRQAYATGDVCADGALTFVPKADPAREAAERAADRAERWAAVAHG